MSCPNCYATKRETLPNISAYPVAHKVLEQSVINTWNRVMQVMQGEMEMSELEEANLNLTVWLAQTFTGQNEHFSCESEFNEGILLNSLRESVGSDIKAQNPDFDFNDDESFAFNVALQEIAGKQHFQTPDFNIACPGWKSVQGE